MNLLELSESRALTEYLYVVGGQSGEKSGNQATTVGRGWTIYR